MKKDLSIAMAIAKKNKKKMAEGGDVDKFVERQKNKPKVKGVHEAIMRSDPGTSVAGSYHGKYGSNQETSKRIHKEKLEESRAMPKPNIKGLAQGGSVDTAETVIIPDRGHGKIIRTGLAEGGHVLSGKNRIDNEKGVNRPGINFEIRGKETTPLNKAIQGASQDHVNRDFKKNNKIKHMAEGGKVKSDMDHGSKNGPEGYSKYQEQSQNQKGVHKPVSGVTGFPGGKGTSQAGDYAKDRHDGKAILNDEAKKEHHKVIEESRKMPKPKIQGLARGGMVESSLIKAHPLDAIGQILKDHEAHLESQMPPEDETEHMDYNDEHALHSQDMAEGGEVDEYGYPVKHPTPAPRLDAIKPAAPKPMQPKEKSIYDYAEGGEVMEDDMMEQPEPEAEDEDHASIAAAIMAKRSKFAEGGQVDIDENAEEQSNMYYKLNKAALKENYDSDMDDVSQPEDSNEENDSIESDDHDKISVMRRKMALKRMAK